MKELARIHALYKLVVKIVPTCWLRTECLFPSISLVLPSTARRRSFCEDRKLITQITGHSISHRLRYSRLHDTWRISLSVFGQVQPRRNKYVSRSKSNQVILRAEAVDTERLVHSRRCSSRRISSNDPIHQRLKSFQSASVLADNN